MMDLIVEAATLETWDHNEGVAIEDRDGHDIITISFRRF